MLRPLLLLTLIGALSSPQPPAQTPGPDAPASKPAPAPSCSAYRTDFITTPSDCADATGTVTWCKPDWFGKGACDDPGALRIIADADRGQILRVSWADADIVAVELTFNYWQHQGQGEPDAAASWVQHRPLRADEPECAQSGFTDLKRLPRTSTTVTCTKETVRIDIDPKDRAAAIRFLKRPAGPRTPALLIDNLRLTFIPAPTPAPD